MLHLLRNPEQLAAFEAEVKANPPVDSIYPMKDMPFSEACLRETGRIYNNLLILRYVPRDIRVPSGLVIPKGLVAISPATVQMDPELYEEPGKWNPQRFLPSLETARGDVQDASNRSFATLSRNYQYVQFGGGKHVCSGEKLTHTLLRASVWPTLIDNYHLEVVGGITEGEGVDGVGVMPDHIKNSLGTPYAANEVYVKVTRRETPLSSAAHVE